MVLKKNILIKNNFDDAFIITMTSFEGLAAYYKELLSTKIELRSLNFCTECPTKHFQSKEL